MHEPKLCILDPVSMFKEYDLHRVQSLEEKLEDLHSLSLNYWLTKFIQEVANKNGGRYSCVLLFLIDFQTHLFENTCVWICKHTVFYRGIMVHPCDLNAGTQLVYHLMNH